MTFLCLKKQKLTVAVVSSEAARFSQTHTHTHSHMDTRTRELTNLMAVAAVAKGGEKRGKNKTRPAGSETEEEVESNVECSAQQ